MPSLRDLRKRRCAEDLIHVIEQFPARVAVRTPIGLDNSSLTMVVFWTLLRWERMFWVACLEKLGVDMWALTCELDALLGERQAVHRAAYQEEKSQRAWSPWLRYQLDQFLDPLLDRAQHEASAMGHGYLGTEHLLLAILAHADASLTSLLSRHEIRYQNVKKAIIDALPLVPSVEVVGEPIPVTVRRKPWGAGWDSEAVGVPRRFSLAVLFLMVTCYAVLFAGMQSLGAHPTIFAVIAVLVTGVGVGQTLLFGGAYPRAASIWAGACLFPVEILVVLVSYYLSSPDVSLSPEDVVEILVLMLVCIPTGAFLGYLSGGLVAGVFLLHDRFTNKMQSRRPSDRGRGDCS